MATRATKFAKRVFQIAYDEEAGLQSAAPLRSRGHAVISVLSNEAAKVLRSSIQKYDLFIIGHAGPEKCRSEMVDWLKAHYTDVKVLALNSLQLPLANADHNSSASDPQSWLLFVSEQFPMAASHASSLLSLEPAPDAGRLRFSSCLH